VEKWTFVPARETTTVPPDNQLRASTRPVGANNRSLCVAREITPLACNEMLARLHNPLTNQQPVTAHQKSKVADDYRDQADH
jgi:hypothetical protein